MNNSVGVERDGKPFESLITNITTCYRQKMALYSEMKKISADFIGGPTGDAAKHAARMPEITARIKYIDQTIFDITPIICVLLLDQEKPDSEGLLSRLRITKTERQELIDTINESFGAKLDDKDSLYYAVRSASVLRDYLKKDFKCSDEP